MSDKFSKVKSVIAAHRKQYGNGTIGLLSENIVDEVHTTSTGSMQLDLLIGNNTLKGIPEGRITEFYGPEASMKTTFALYSMKEFQDKSDKLCAFLDVEQAFDPNLADMIGIDRSRLIFAQPDTTEKTFQLAEELIKTGEVGFLVIDSVAAMVPQAELEGEYGESKMGVQARLMSQAMRKLTAIINQNKTRVIFTNQIREKIGVMYGNPETTTGGNALKYYASLRLEFRASKMKDKDTLGRVIKIKLIKSKISAAAVGKTTEINYYYSVGLDKYADLVEIAASQNVIQKKGSWYSDGETKLGQGSDSVRQLLIDNEEYYNELLKRTKEVLNNEAGYTETE